MLYLKNVSVLANTEGLQRLSPAYDLLCTRLVIDDDPLALPVLGKRDKLTRKTWVELGEYARLGPKAIERTLAETSGALERALGLVRRSALPREMKKTVPSPPRRADRRACRWRLIAFAPRRGSHDSDPARAKA